MENNLKLHLNLYYNFGGSSSWLKDEIVKKRYDSFRYFIPVEKKEDANLIVEIYSPNKEKGANKYLNITLRKKMLGMFSVSKNICDNLAISSSECDTIYSFLKKTYFERV